jgi:hypothetical protein
VICAIDEVDIAAFLKRSCGRAARAGMSANLARVGYHVSGGRLR